jgi:hypothetical protein
MFVCCTPRRNRRVGLPIRAETDAWQRGARVALGENRIVEGEGRGADRSLDHRTRRGDLPIKEDPADATLADLSITFLGKRT